MEAVLTSTCSDASTMQPYEKMSWRRDSGSKSTSRWGFQNASARLELPQRMPGNFRGASDLKCTTHAQVLCSHFPTTNVIDKSDGRI